MHKNSEYTNLNQMICMQENATAVASIKHL